MSSSNQRYIKGRAADAVNTLQEACAIFERTINSSVDQSFSEHDENDLNQSKRRKFEETPEDRIRALKDKLLKCQTKLIAAETDKEMQLSLFHKDTLEKDEQLRKLKNLLEDATKEREATVKIKKQIEATLEKERSEWESKQNSLQREVQLLQKRSDELDAKRNDLSTALERERTSHTARRSSGQKEIFELQRQLIEAQTGFSEANEKNFLLEENQRLKDSEIARLSSELSRITSELNDLKTKVEENEWATNVVENAKNLEEKMKIMAQWETEIIQLRKDNEKLRQDRSNVSLMREKLFMLENIKDSANRTRERCAELECDLQVSQRLCQEWEQGFNQIDASLNSPEAVLKRIQKLQASEMCLLEENSKLKTELALLENGQRLESKEAKTIKRLERKLRLIAKERDSYRSVLDSYENDVTINPVSMQSRRVATLESFVEEYRKLISELEADGCHRAKQTATVEVQTESAGQQNYDDGLRLIHFRMNPLDIAHQERIDQLKEIQKENDFLRARVKALEERGVADQSVPDLSLSELMKDDPRKLRTELEAAKKRQERIMAAFKKTSKEFRQAVYCLTGYRIDMTANRCVLRHVYADHPDDQLEFEIAENGFLHLLSNEYSLKLDQLTSTYLRDMDSIPAFLSALTLQLFNSQTVMQIEQPSMFVMN
ncbi:mitotic spindle assembly checkpoint protein MAD1 [Galendromus occidentalis]|uniref:Mitotic spindle assembly checkpoint protein MAD1 n=1 Tax=Galendromus occidentalis TaxID=34638 RepID=A0AAJ7SEC0_9ACAR|nr:mitotic spindle assembly checkpoint protein MAD1 [Galendromus occidentalis]